MLEQHLINEVIRMREEGRSYEKISEHLGVTVSTIKNRFYATGMHKKTRAVFVERRSAEILGLLKEGKKPIEVARILGLHVDMVYKTPGHKKTRAYQKRISQDIRYKIYREWKSGTKRKVLSFKYGVCYAVVAKIISKINDLPMGKISKILTE